MTELAAIDPTTLGAADRVRLLVAWERQSAWVAAQQLPVLVAVGDAYAETTAGMRLHLARALPVRLPLLGEALRTGRVSFGHILLVSRETAPLTDELARGVDARLARRYRTATPGELRNAARHATIAADPVGAQARHDEATRRRSLSTRPEPDGMASLNLFAAAPDVAIVDSAVSDIAERTAAAATAAGRLIPDQDSLRADALVAMARYWLHDTWPVPEPDPRRAPPARGGPAREFMADEPRTGEPLPDDDGVPGGESCNDPPVRMGKRGRRRRGRDHTVVNIVIDLPTLLGLADNPARLDGYGPIPPGLARRLAADAAWRRMITDPITRRLLDRAPNTYRPGDNLAAYVRARATWSATTPAARGRPRAASSTMTRRSTWPTPTVGAPSRRMSTCAASPITTARPTSAGPPAPALDGTRFTRSPLGFDYDLEPNAYLDVGSLKAGTSRLPTVEPS